MSTNSSRLEEQIHSDGQREMFRDRQEFVEGDMQRGEYVDKLTDHGLEPMTAEYMENLLSPDFVLSKITEAEKGEMRWMVRQQFEKIKAMHPPQRGIAGDDMAALLDDEDAELTPLTDYQIQLLETGVFDIFFRVARSVGGWQQQELSSQYNVSEVVNEGDEGGSRLRGLFS